VYTEGLLITYVSVRTQINKKQDNEQTIFAEHGIYCNTDGVMLVFFRAERYISS